MVRFILLSILITIVARMFWRLVDGVFEGMRGPAGSRDARSPAVPMVRDPVCGTFVIPERAVTLVEGARRVYFCSDSCRDKYRARTA
jgi:YHS domain-containing protein